VRYDAFVELGSAPAFRGSTFSSSVFGKSGTSAGRGKEGGREERREEEGQTEGKRKKRRTGKERGGGEGEGGREGGRKGGPETRGGGGEGQGLTPSPGPPCFSIGGVLVLPCCCLALALFPDLFLALFLP
jgi:hypothetical protein